METCANVMTLELQNYVYFFLLSSMSHITIISHTTRTLSHKVSHKVIMKICLENVITQCHLTDESSFLRTADVY